MAVSELTKLHLSICQVLSDISDAFHISNEKLIEQEDLTYCSVSTSYKSEDFAQAMTIQRVQEWFQCFEKDLSVDIVISEPHEEICIRQSNINDILRIHTISDEYFVKRINVSLTIRKEFLRAKIETIVNSRITAIFFTCQPIIPKLTLRGMSLLIKESIIEVEGHTTLLFIKESGKLEGPYLTILGMTDTTIDDFQRKEIPFELNQNWQNARTLREDIAIWQAPLGSVNPNLFLLKSYRPGFEIIANATLGLCALLSLLQFCSSVVEESRNTWKASILQQIGPNFSIDSGSILSFNDPKDQHSLLQLYNWAFSGEGFDKIDIVRDVIRRENRDKREASLSAIIDIGDDLLDIARANYHFLRHKAFETYQHARSEMYGKVRGLVEAIQKQIDSLRKDLIDRSMQFIATVFAFMIANTFNPKVTSQFIILGLVLSAVYLALVIVFQIIPSWQRYNETRKQAILEINSYTEISLRERHRIASTIPRGRWNSFTIWYYLCIGVYILFITIILAIGGIYLSSQGVKALPHPILTPIPAQSTTITISPSP